MTGFVDLYTEGDTVLHRMDPRVKIFAVLMLTLLILMISSLVHLLILLAFIALLVALGRAPFSKVSLALRFVLRVMIMIVILWPIFDPSGTPVLATLGPVRITEPGVMRGITNAVRICCLATVWYVLMFTTPQRDLVRALVKLGVRFDFGLTLSIALRFLPTFSATVESIKDAQRARGMEFDKGSPLRRSRNYISVLIPTIISALRTADTLSLALQSRAYGARRHRTYLRELKMRASDGVALAVVVAAFVMPAVAKFFLKVPV